MVFFGEDHVSLRTEIKIFGIKFATFREAAHIISHSAKIRLVNLYELITTFNYLCSVFNENTPIEKIWHPDIENSGVELWLKRDDLIHQDVSGNKWRKLKHYVSKIGDKDGICTFGGAYSNHIAATAAIGNLLGIKTYGIIRGDELTEQSNQTLAEAAMNGMHLIFVSREEYKYRNEREYHKQIKSEYGNLLIVPEGGAGYEGIVGASEIVRGHGDFDLFAVPCGTGTTLTGILVSLKSHQMVRGYSVLKGNFMRDEVNRFLRNFFVDPEIEEEYQSSFEIVEDYHFGGYARVSEELISFLRSFYNYTNIKLDPVYTGKMMFGLINDINQQRIPSGQKVLAIHTGGLQGIAGMESLQGTQLFE